MSSINKLSKKTQIKMMEKIIINHSFMIDAIINVLIENDICSFEDLKSKININSEIIEKQLKKESLPPSNDDDIPMMTYYGPMGEA